MIIILILFGVCKYLTHMISLFRRPKSLILLIKHNNIKYIVLFL